MREYLCHFCMEVTASDDGAPDRCGHCKVSYCLACGTALKGVPPRFCHGCGAVAPAAQGRFVPADATASVYVVDDWARAHLGADCGPLYEVVYGLEDGVRAVWLQRRDDPRSWRGEPARRLSGEEIAALERRDSDG